MSDTPVGAMSDADEIAALRADMQATADEHMAAAEAAKAAAQDHTAAAIEHERAAREIADLQAQAASSSMPNAQIKAGWAALRAKFTGLFR